MSCKQLLIEYKRPEKQVSFSFTMFSNLKKRTKLWQNKLKNMISFKIQALILKNNLLWAQLFYDFIYKSQGFFLCNIVTKPKLYLSAIINIPGFVI